LLFRAKKVDITPQIPCVLGGFSRRMTPQSDISQPIEANIIILEQNEQKTVILSLDVLFVTDELKKVLMLVAKQYGITNEKDFLLAASHTHFAPSLETKRPLLGTGTTAYYDWLVAQLLTLIKDCFNQAPQEVTLLNGVSKADHAVNRRVKIFFPREFKTQMCMLPNVEGAKDESLYSLVFFNKQKEPLAILWSYACHPVSFPNIFSICADYIGYCRDQLRFDYSNSKLPVVFLQGFCGDTRPKPPTKKLGLYSKLRLLFRLTIEEDLWSFKESEYKDWVSSLANTLSENVKSAKHNEDVSILENTIKTEPLKKFGIHSEATLHFHIQTIALGKILIIAFSGEVVAEYTRIVKSLFPNKLVIPVGYINTVFGYLPTQKILQEGGYEATDSFTTFALTGAYEGNPEEVLKTMIMT
jgi:hypothetical protein